MPLPQSDDRASQAINDGLERIWDLLKSALLRGQVSLFAGQWESASIANIGFIGFFVFMLTMGIALLRRRSQPDEATQASAQEPS